MPVNKGAPLRALSAIAAIWISVRIIWEAVFPSAVLLPIAMAGAAMTPPGGAPEQIDAVVLQDQPASMAASRLSRDVRKQSDRFEWKNNAPSIKKAERSAVLANISAPPKPSAMKERTLVKSGTGLQHQIPLRLQDATSYPSSKPLSGYFWVFARQGSGSGRSGPTVPTLGSPGGQYGGGQYGGSQAGAILTYRLAGASQRSLSAFVRASTAISDAGQEELAIGIKAHPFAGVPLSLFAEQRMGAGRFRSRGTSVYVAGGTGPDLLIPHTSLETYGQAGFVFAGNSSYFFDASASLQRKLWERGHYKLTAGAGVWAGGQKGLTRLDIGPRADIHVPVGTRHMRLSLDWRQRVGGNAVPDSGVAVTVTTGF